MSIALAGLILIQYFWLSNAIKLKQEDFDRRVYAALRGTADKMELKQGLNFFAESLKGDSSLLREMNDVDSGFSQFIINTETISNEDGEKVKVVVRSHDDSAGHKRVYIKTTTNSNKDLISEVSTQELPAPPTPPEPPLPPALPLEKKEKFLSIVQSAANAYAGSKISWQQAIDSVRLLQTAASQFAGQHLPSDYALVVYNTETDTVVYSSKQTKGSPAGLPYSVVISGQDFSLSPLMLGVNFQSKNSFILSSILGLLALSLVFTAVVIVAFVMALWLIFKQKKINEVTGDFINNMTHEFKTPLATIAMTADTLKLAGAQANTDTVNEYAALIKEETKKLSQHVDRILEAAQSESRVNILVEKVNLKEALNSAYRQTEPGLHANDGAIKIDVDDSLNVRAGQSALVYVFTNLLDNAIKYNTGKPHVTVTANSSANTITLGVKDNGIGISAAEQKLIFDKFYRVHTGNRHDVKGFGLGLNFVKNSVESWGGKVWVDSTPGLGSTFYVQLLKA